MKNFFISIFIFGLAVTPSYANGAKHLKHEFRISNIGLAKAFSLSGQETYFAYFINPSFLDAALLEWNNKAEEKRQKEQKKFPINPKANKLETTQQEINLKYEFQKSKYKIHQKASWEDASQVIVVIAPYMRIEPHTFDDDEYHSNKGNPTGSKIIKDKEGSLVCEPSSMEVIESWDPDYLKHVYAGWDLSGLMAGNPEGFPFDKNLPLTVFKYKPDCFITPNIKFILETTKGSLDSGMGEIIFKEIKADFHL